MIDGQYRAERLFVFRGGDLLLPQGCRGADGRISVERGVEATLGLLDSLPLAARRDYPSGGLACSAIRIAPPVAAADGASGPGAGGSGAGPGGPGAGGAPLPPQAGFEALPFRSALAELPAEEASRAAKGLSLLNWHDVARYCGACGAALEDDAKEGWTNGARRCSGCGRVFYPRVSPAVIILVRRDDRILLAHNAAFPKDRFGLIAGFVEPGEGIEETARRELREETSLEISSLRYISSQPWPFPDSLMLAFEAEWAAGEATPDGVELTELRWCGRDDLPSIPPPGSVARRLIDRWLEGR
jgi:NAD+ diphosphatase